MVFYSPFSFGADDRALFRSPLLFLLLFLAYNLTHSDFALLDIADGVANSRFIGCFVALFFLQVLPHATLAVARYVLAHINIFRPKSDRLSVRKKKRLAFSLSTRLQAKVAR